MHAKPVLVKLK